MKAYGRNLQWIRNRQCDDNGSTKIRISSSGKKRGQQKKRYNRPFKKMERQYAKRQILEEVIYY